MHHVSNIYTVLLPQGNVSIALMILNSFSAGVEMEIVENTKYYNSLCIYLH